MTGPKPSLEYVTISISPNNQGHELQISPKRPDTDTAVEAARSEGLAGALNKLAEYGYRLLEGTVLSVNLSAAEGTLFMYREVETVHKLQEQSIR